MNVHYLQHVPYEGLGNLDALLRSRGHRIRGTRLDLDDPLPDHPQIDWLIILGGPMGVYDSLPWLAREQELIRWAIDADKIVLGICLGAQLIAATLGGTVQPNPYREIGWHKISRLDSARSSPLAAILPAQLDVFHWHGDTFSIPVGAVPLASSAACPNQAFSYGSRVLALQFHLETTLETAQGLISHCAAELDDNASAPYVQAAAEILARPDRFNQISNCMAQLVDTLERTTTRA
jgi:GMP synthase (glutamine-hydrolysing)